MMCGAIAGRAVGGLGVFGGVVSVHHVLRMQWQPACSAWHESALAIWEAICCCVCGYVLMCHVLVPALLLGGAVHPAVLCLQ